MVIDVIKVLVPAALAFFTGLALAPILASQLYKYQMWKKKSVTLTLDGQEAVFSKKIHNDEGIKTPRMGGVVVWGSALVTVIFMWLIAAFTSDGVADKLSFLSRNQTWLPLFTLITTALVGLLDDYLVVSDKGKYIGGGLSLATRLGLVALVGLVGGWWFYFKLEVTAITIPFFGDISIGLLLIPLFLLTMLVVYTGGIIDGVDGLSGGVFSSMFAAYAIIAFSNQQIDLAAFCAVIVGGLLAFLWFNVPPALFYLSETGTMGLTTTLAVVAFLTNSVGVLPIIALPLIATSLSSIIQILSKKFRKKKILLVAPLHHHFEAIGWPSYRVTMRYWIVSVMCVVVGVIVALAG